MVDVSGCHCELGGGEEGRRARSEETSFADHEVIVASPRRTGPLRAGRPLRGVYTGQGKASGLGPRAARRVNVPCFGTYNEGLIVRER